MGLASHILRFEVGKNILETICSQWTGLRDGTNYGSWPRGQALNEHTLPGPAYHSRKLAMQGHLRMLPIFLLNRNFFKSSKGLGSNNIVLAGQSKQRKETQQSKLHVLESRVVSPSWSGVDRSVMFVIGRHELGRWAT